MSALQHLSQCFEIVFCPASPVQNINASTGNTNASNSNQSDVMEELDKKGRVKEHPDSVADDKEDKKKQSKVPLTDVCPVVAPDPEQEETETKTQSDSKKNLALRFKIYEASQKDVTHILSSWDRVQGILLIPLNEGMQQQTEQRRQHLSSYRARKSREERLKRLEKERLESKRLEKLKALVDSKSSLLEGEGAEGSVSDQHVGVPSLDIQVVHSEDVTRAILESSRLPAAEQVRLRCSDKAQMLSLPWPWSLVHCVPPNKNSTDPCPGH